MQDVGYERKGFLLPRRVIFVQKNCNLIQPNSLFVCTLAWGTGGALFKSQQMMNLIGLKWNILISLKRTDITLFRGHLARLVKSQATLS